LRVNAGTRPVKTAANHPMTTQTKAPMAMPSTTTPRGIAKIARLDSITVDTPVSGAAARLLLGEATLILPLEGVIDIAAEKARLSKEIGKLAGDIAKITGKLGNDAFVAKAPPEVIDEQRERLAEAEAARAKLSEALARLG